MKLFLAMALGLLLGGCTQTATDNQSGSGSGTTPSTDSGSTPTSTSNETASPAPPTTETSADYKPPVDRRPKDGEDVAVMETSMGRIVLMFFPDKAPKHVANYKKLSKTGFYDGTKFHRVIPGFMIQGGDPNTKKDDPSMWGQGGPGYTVNAEFSDIHHARGILSMARAQDPNSAGSQFFIVVADSGFLDKQYTVFGQVLSGMDVADKIVSVKTEPGDRPVDPPVIKSLKIVKWPVK